ncbi:hypothetical protein CFP56_026687 [Quercus suber]|uniref:Aluminum-activated malate transporter n=1 Tax=Quercus suber TaxID=58331 RepID=A0AAW0K1M9_QUESU
MNQYLLHFNRLCHLESSNSRKRSPRMAAFAIAAVTAVVNLLDKVLQCIKNMSNGVSANIEDVKRLFSTLIAYLTDTE